MNRIAALQSLIGRTGVPIERASIAAGTVKTGYLAAGSGQPVLLLHGDGAGAIVWYSVIGSLSSHFRVIAPDIVGYGESEKPSAQYDRPFFCAWLGYLLGALRLHKTALVGNSLGGAIALQFTVEHPEQVSKLALVDSSGLGELRRVPPGVFLATLFYNVFPSRWASLWLSRYALLNPQSVDKAMAQYSREVKKMPGGTRAFWQGRGRANTRIPADQLGQIRQETLIVWGKEDRYFPASQAESAAKAISHARLHIIPDAGHVPFLDQPEAFNDVLVRFLRTTAD